MYVDSSSEGEPTPTLNLIYASTSATLNQCLRQHSCCMQYYMETNPAALRFYLWREAIRGRRTELLVHIPFLNVGAWERCSSLLA